MFRCKGLAGLTFLFAILLSATSFAAPFVNANINLTAILEPGLSTPDGTFNIGPYEFSDGTNGFPAVCFANCLGIEPGTYNVDAYNLETLIRTASTGLNAESYANPAALSMSYIDLYEAGAYLANIVLTHPGSQGATNAQLAAWALSAPAGDLTVNAGLGDMERGAIHSIGSLSPNFYSQFVIYLPAENDGPDILREVPLVTPEPASVALVASGLFAIGAWPGAKFLLALKTRVAR